MSKSNRVRLNWSKYNWEQFENICYAYASEKYDADAYKVTITARRKDGGRDIVIYDKEQKDHPGESASIIRVHWG